jgi:hypothetical protein
MTPKGGQRELNRTRFVVAWLSVVTLATGCTTVLAGTAGPVPNIKPRPLSGETVKQVLLDEAALSKPEWPSAFGGAEQLETAGTVSAPDCVGVTAMTEPRPYQSANVQNVARQHWWAVPTAAAKVLKVSEAVVALPTAAEATALLGKFSAQWDKCQGQTVTTAPGHVVFSDQISDVRVADSVLAGTVLHEIRVSGFPPSPNQVARAIGVRVNCLVELYVDFFNLGDPADEGRDYVRTTAIELAHAMMDKVSTLS